MVVRLDRFPDFINQDECDELNAWVELGVKQQWLYNGNSNGYKCENRLTTRFYGDRFIYPTLVYAIYQRIKDQIGIQNRPVPFNHGKDGIVVSYIKKGGDVFPHKDPRSYNRLATLRCNILTQSTNEGGNLFLNDDLINIKERELHCYLASEHEHYVSEVLDSKPRILWMFGICIPANEWEL